MIFTKVMEIPENELIRRLGRFGKRNSSIFRGIGDDGAVVGLEGIPYVFVQDAMVEHVHFELTFMDAFYVGKKSIYVNVSDILSMGAEPLYFLVTLGVPRHISYREIERLYEGMKKAATEFNISLLGGDTTSTREELLIDVSMVGRLVTQEYLGRNKADVGDLIGVTGVLGESAYGLELLKKGPLSRGSGRFVERYRSPKPPHPLWREVVNSGITIAMMDISDGLLIDLERMMEQSRKAAVVRLESIPMPPFFRKQGKEELALSGGEDYQFLFTFPKEKLPVFKALKEKGLSLSIIGEVTRGKGVKLLSHGVEIRPGSKGYQHFGDTP
jgi:thiamine-monophosphate kinase